MSKVKSISAYNYQKTENGLENKTPHSYTEFDSNGNEIVSITYFDTGEIETKIITEFDENGNKSKEINYLDDEQIAEEVTFKRNSDNKLEREIIAYADGSESIKKYERNPEDNSVNIITVDDEDYLEEKEQLKLNENDLVIERTIFDEDENITEKHCMEYDENKNLIRRLEYGEGGDDLLTERLFSYDKNNNMIKRLSLTKDKKLIDVIEQEFDEKNRVLSQKFGKSYLIKHSYDDDENTYTEERINAEGMIEYRCVSKYDENNYLIEEEKPLSVTKYEYKYYN